MLVAKVVQVGMAAMAFGYDLVGHVFSGLQALMDRKSYHSPEDSVGIAHMKVIVPGLDLSHVPLLVRRSLVVDKATCIGCGLCVKGYNASA